MRSSFQRWLLPAFVLAVALLASPSLADSAQAAPGQNGQIAFVSFRDGDPEVYTMNPDGTQQTRTTFNVGPSPALPLLDFWPSWSSDGEKIVYTSFRGLPPNGDVFIMNANGTGQTRITTNPAGDLDPALSSDGTKIVFVREVPGANFGDPPLAQDIWTMNADGTGEVNLTPGPEHETEPAFSPDGTKIAFERNVGGGASHDSGNHEIFTMNANGTGVTQLTNTATVREQHPNFSPDGTKIVFDDNFHAAPGVPGLIYRMNASDGSAVTPLTSNRTDRHGLAAYSPDGTKISFTASEDIYVMNADGSNQTPLTNHPAPDIQASWGTRPPRAALRPPGTPAASAALRAGACANERLGSNASETMNGTSVGDRLLSLGGNDRLNGRQGDDCLFGGSGGDRLTGAEGKDRLRGDSGNDVLGGSSGRDRVSGGRGNDKLAGDSGGDRLWGRVGRDRLSGGPGNDRLSGGSGNDRLNGGSGRNRLSGGSGNDSVNSANGRRETVDCGSGRDVVRADRSDHLRGCERVRRG